MSSGWTKLGAIDGHVLDAYRVEVSNAWGAVVLIQEIFGVNGHIRAVADRLGQAGLNVLAPALFDRLQPKVSLGYDSADIAEGRKFRTAISWAQATQDVSAAVGALAATFPVATMGFCWGGSVSWLAASQLSVRASVCYYGGQIHALREHAPQKPVLLHFGQHDALIPLEQVEALKALYPQAATHVYAAGHGFNCDQRADFDPAAAGQAWERTLDFLRLHLK